MRHNFLGNNGLKNAKLEIYNEKNYDIIVKHAFEINSQYHNLHLGRVYISHKSLHDSAKNTNFLKTFVSKSES